jgi:type IX secretion system substrate protein
MKTKVFTIALAMGLTFAAKAQVLFQSSFENWTSTTPIAPTDWMGPKTNISPDSVIQSSTAYAGSFSVQLDRNIDSVKRFSVLTTTIAITQGMAYEVSYYAKGKGELEVGLFSGKMTNGYFGYVYAANKTISSNSSWTRYAQSIIADTINTTTANFFLGVRDVNSADHLLVDSVCIKGYTVSATPVSIHNIQYTTLASGASPYYGQIVNCAGGIVTAVYNGTGGTQSGYYIQNTGAGNRVWSGVQVYDYTNIVAMGDSISFTAAVDEYFGNTELQPAQVSNWVKHSSGNALPIPLVLITDSLNEGSAYDIGAGEKFQGCLVTTMTLSTCDTYSANYGQGTINDGSGATQVDKQIFPYTFQIGQKYKVTGVVCTNYGLNIEPRFIADIDSLSSVGIEQYNNTLHASVYPNPVANDLTIQLSFNAEKINVSVIDVLGREVLTANPVSGTQVSLQNINLPSGVYMVKIIADDKQQLVKITKQ